jgi:hypothetical protein
MADFWRGRILGRSYLGVTTPGSGCEHSSKKCALQALNCPEILTIYGVGLAKGQLLLFGKFAKFRKSGLNARVGRGV